MRRRWWIVKVEIGVRFNTGEIVEDFLELYKIEFKAPKFKWFESKSTQPFQVAYDKWESEGTLLVKRR